MKKTSLPTLLLVVLFFAACSKEETPLDFSLDQPDLFTEDDYELYNLSVTGLTLVPIRQQTSVTTVSEEVFQEYVKTYAEEFKKMDDNLYQNFIDANDAHYFLDAQRIKSSEVKIKIISNKEHDYYFTAHDTTKGWELFVKKYPDPSGHPGFRIFSKIGYNDAGTQALVAEQSYYTDEGYQTSKMGRLYYYEKVNGTWKTNARWLTYPLQE